MPQRATERWSDRQYVRGESAQRAWDVIGCADEEQVVAAVRGEWGVDQGATHPLDNRLVANKPVVVTVAPAGRMWKYTLPYRFTGGGAGGELDLPPLLEWGHGWDSMRPASDFYKNALTNSAGDVSPDVEHESVPTSYLTIRRWESAFDIQRGYFFRDAVNNDQFALFGKYQVFPGQAHCQGIAPAQAYKVDATPQVILYRFEFRAGKVQDPDGLWDGFKRHEVDKGRDGWYSSGNRSVRGHITNGAGERVTNDVLLDGYGRPLDPDLRVAGAVPVGNPNPLPPNVYLEFGPGNERYLKRQMKPLRPFANMFN